MIVKKILLVSLLVVVSMGNCNVKAFEGSLLTSFALKASLVLGGVFAFYYAKEKINKPKSGGSSDTGAITYKGNFADLNADLNILSSSLKKNMKVKSKEHADYKRKLRVPQSIGFFSACTGIYLLRNDAMHGLKSVMNLCFGGNETTAIDVS